MRTVGLALAILAGCYGLAAVGFGYAMRQPPQQFSRVMMHAGPAPFMLFPFERMWKSARQGRLHVGDPAPDFTLERLDHRGRVRLSTLRGKPVVLVFGSYT